VDSPVSGEGCRDLLTCCRQRQLGRKVAAAGTSSRSDRPSSDLTDSDIGRLAGRRISTPYHHPRTAHLPRRARDPAPAARVTDYSPTSSPDAEKSPAPKNTHHTINIYRLEDQLLAGPLPHRRPRSATVPPLSNRQRGKRLGNSACVAPTLHGTAVSAAQSTKSIQIAKIPAWRKVPHDSSISR
jgi:hypothetical protein